VDPQESQEYREFDGPHVVPPELAAEAAEWALR